MKQAQDCSTITDGANVVSVFGSHNVINGVDQQLTFSVNRDCVNNMTAQADFQSKLSAKVAQAMSDQSVAMTEWMDTGKSTQSTVIDQSVTNKFSSDVSQKCLASLSGVNVIDVRGTGNIVENVRQKQAQSVVSKCMQGSAQAMSAITDISNTVNQGSTKVSTNPLSFISDAFVAMGQSTMAMVAGVVVVVIVMAYMLMS